MAESLALNARNEVVPQISDETLESLSRAYELEAEMGAPQQYQQYPPIPPQRNAQYEAPAEEEYSYSAKQDVGNEPAFLRTVIRTVQKGGPLTSFDLSLIDRRIERLESWEAPLQRTLSEATIKADTHSKVQIRIAERARDRAYRQADAVEAEADAKNAEIEAEKMAEERAANMQFQEGLDKEEAARVELNETIDELESRPNPGPAIVRAIATLKAERRELHTTIPVEGAALKAEMNHAMQQAADNAIVKINQIVKPLRIQAEQLRAQADEELAQAMTQAQAEHDGQLYHEKSQLEMIQVERATLNQIRSMAQVVNRVRPRDVTLVPVPPALAPAPANPRVAAAESHKPQPETRSRVASSPRIVEIAEGTSFRQIIKDKISELRNSKVVTAVRDSTSEIAKGAAAASGGAVANATAVESVPDEKIDTDTDTGSAPAEKKTGKRRKRTKVAAFTALAAVGVGFVVLQDEGGGGAGSENLPAGVLAHSDTLQDTLEDGRIIIEATSPDGETVEFNMLTGEGIVGDDNQEDHDYRNVLNAAMMLTSGGNPDFEAGLIPMSQELIDTAAEDIGVEYDPNDPAVALPVYGRAFNNVSAQLFSTEESAKAIDEDTTGLVFYQLVAQKLDLFGGDQTSINLFANLCQEWQDGVRPTELVGRLMTANDAWIQTFADAEAAVRDRDMLSDSEIDSYS